jgi:hypothetical protein
MGERAQRSCLNASEFGVPRLWPRLVLVARGAQVFGHFKLARTSTRPSAISRASHSKWLLPYKDFQPTGIFMGETPAEYHQIGTPSRHR